MKKRVAVWMFGGIGTGNFSQGQPVLERLVYELSLEFEIVVYSQSLINSDYRAKGFVIKCAPETIRNGTLRWLATCAYFLRDHIRNRFSLVCAFWGFPGGFLATLLARILFLPSMVNLQGGDSVGIASLKYGIMLHPRYRRLALWTYRHATVLSALTQFQKNLVVSYGVSRPIHVIPFGIDCQLFKPTTRTRKEHEPWHFIHVSNYSRIKDPETLLKAFSAIANRKTAKLRIIGGEYEHFDKNFCRESGIEDAVEFCGPVAYTNMPVHYAWADILLHTSLYESQAIVIAEAAASGVLIAGTAVGLISDLGEDASVIVSPEEADSLAAKVIDMIEHPDLLEEKKKAALGWARQFDFFWTVNQYREIINELTRVKAD